MGGTPLRLYYKHLIMKHTGLIIFFVAAVFSLTSCGGTVHMISNYNVAQTTLHLSQDNFKVIGNVEGSAHATYVLGIGGVSKRAIKENAIADMYRNACLTGAQAVTNVTTTMKARFYLFWWEYDFIASGQIIEFTE